MAASPGFSRKAKAPPPTVTRSALQTWVRVVKLLKPRRGGGKGGNKLEKYDASGKWRLKEACAVSKTRASRRDPTILRGTNCGRW